MKNILFAAMFLLQNLLLSQIPADSLRNYNWVLGYGGTLSNKVYQVFFNFNGDSISIKNQVVENGLSMDDMTSTMSDSSGNLLLFSNGCSVYDSTFQPIQGAEKINITPSQDYTCEIDGNGLISNSIVILPDNQGDFNVFSTIFTRIQTPYLRCENIYWTKIVQKNGQFEAILKDSLIVNDIIYGGNLASCRHGNGQDWWLVSPDVNYEDSVGSNAYYMIRIRENAIEIHSDTIGIITDYLEDASGEAVFSPDGTKYARYTIHADLQIFDFDRCGGHFSNPIHIPILDAADTILAAGVAFSPNGQYLYASSSNYIYQFDMKAADIGASKTTVAVYDGYYTGASIFTTRFYQCELAPDGKIYICTPAGRETIHVIEYPDSAGIACKVIQHKFNTGFPIGGLPGYPNFRLAALPDSICPHEMVAIKEPEKLKMNIRIYPNPASESFKIEMQNASIHEVHQLKIINQLGQTLKSEQFKGHSHTVSAENLPTGLVFVQVFEDGIINAVEKLIIAR